jgi:hypothetical protein
MLPGQNHVALMLPHCWFKYLCKEFPHLSEAKLKEGIFDEDFLLTTTVIVREAWIAFRSVVAKFLGNNKDPDYCYYCCKYAREIQKLGVLNELKKSFFF